MALLDALRKLNPTGLDGFEGLIACLLGELTGRRFYLARSGSQQGRDMISALEHSSTVAVECKRYGKDTELDERELLAEIDQATMAIPDLDLWVLVASRHVPDQLITVLSAKATERGIDFHVICHEDGSPSSLETLCAQGSALVMSFLQKNSLQTSDIEDEIDQVARRPGFADSLKRMREIFSDPWIGYAQWYAVQNQWLTTRFREEKGSRAAFHQPLHVAAPDAGLIERKSAWRELDEWLGNWGQQRIPFVLLGEEGDGKTWTVASWINRAIQSGNDFLPAVFLASPYVNTNNPDELISGAIAHQVGKKSQEQWKRRISRWMGREAKGHPLALLVLDGINERWGHRWWRQLFEALASGPWNEKIAILITARKDYWDRHFRSLRHILVKDWLIPPYNDPELDAALKRHELSRGDIPDDLLPLIRKPRYLDLVVKHRREMVESGDPTVARLIYEDWRHRWEKKTQLSIDDQDFQTLIKNLAEKARQNQTRFSEAELVEGLVLNGERGIVLDELISSGVLSGRPGKYKVDQRRLVLGLGLILADRVEEAIEDGDNTEETISAWLEPHQEMEIKGRICEMAALHSLSLDSFPESGRVILLQTWLQAKNPGESSEENFIAYLPLQPKSYLELSERIWSDAFDNPWGQELIVEGLRRWHASPRVAELLPDTFAKWLGFIHPFGNPLQRENTGTSDPSAAVHEKIRQRLGGVLKPGPMEFSGLPLTVIEDDGLLRLGRVALAVISHIPRKSYVRAVAVGCLAEAIMDFPGKYKLMAWVLRSSPEVLWEDVERQARILLLDGSRPSQQAAYRLLSCEGSDKARELQRTLSEDIFPPNPLREMHEKDPCISLFQWRRKDFSTCIAREDLAPYLVARKMQRYCLDPRLCFPPDLGQRLSSLTARIDPHSIWTARGMTAEDHYLEEIESALCACAPLSISGVMRAIVKTASSRDGKALRSLSFVIGEHDIILDDAAQESLFLAWDNLISRWEVLERDEKITEMFLFEVVLGNVDASTQLKLILQRPNGARDLIRYERRFKILSNWDQLIIDLKDDDPVKVYRTVWFLGKHPQTVPRELVTEMLELIQHNDSLVRACAFSMFYKLGDERAAMRLKETGWTWGKSHSEFEDHWGSLLLARFAKHLPYNELRCFVHPVYLGFAVIERGKQEGEIDQYASDVHRMWSINEGTRPAPPEDFPPAEIGSTLTSANVPFERFGLSRDLWSKSVKFTSRDAFWGGLTGVRDSESLKDAFDPLNEEQQQLLMDIVKNTVEEQVEAGNLWFARRFYSHALDDVVRRRPDLAAEWLNTVFTSTDGSSLRFQMNRSFYEALCQVLLKVDIQNGVKLYKHLDKATPFFRIIDERTRIPVIQYALFDTQPVPDVQCEWENCLEKCKSDQDLLSLVILVQAGTAGRGWLKEKIAHDLSSPVVFLKARATILRGLWETEDMRNELKGEDDSEPEHWFDKVIDRGRQYCDINIWARHWFRRFLEIEDDALAWAAFRLFMKCADRRFWNLRSDMLQTIPVKSERRLVFLSSNLDRLMNAIKKNEEPLGKEFLGNEVMNREAWPWM